MSLYKLRQGDIIEGNLSKLLFLLKPFLILNIVTQREEKTLSLCWMRIILLTMFGASLKTADGRGIEIKSRAFAKNYRD